MDKNTLSHTTWECKYHIVFAPKFRKQKLLRIFKGKNSLMIFDRHHKLKV